MTAEAVEWCQRDTVRRHVRRAAMLIAVGRDLHAARRNLEWRMANLSSVDRSTGAVREPRLQKRPTTIALQFGCPRSRAQQPIERLAVLRAAAAPARIARRRLFRARFFADSFTLFATRAHRSAPNQAPLGTVKKGDAA
jgi:hypothetical protein